MILSYHTYGLLIFGFISGLSGKTLPDTIPRCYRNDPNLGDCIVKATETLRPQIIKGVPELAIPPADPYVIPSVNLQQAAKSISFKMELKNLTISGLSSYNFSQFDFDPETLTWNFKVTYGKLSTTSQCRIEGKILVLPLSGQGTVFLSVEESTYYETTVKCKMAKIKGVDHLEITNITTKFPRVEKTVTRLENFDTVKPEILEAINRVINENSEEFRDDVVVTIKEFLYSFMDTVISGILKKVPYDELFPISDKFQ